MIHFVIYTSRLFIVYIVGMAAIVTSGSHYRSESMEAGTASVT